MRSLVLLALLALAAAGPLSGGYGEESAPKAPTGAAGGTAGGDDMDKEADDTAAAIGLKPFTFPMGAVFPAHHGLMNGQDMGSEYGGGGPPPSGSNGPAKYYGVIVPNANGQNSEQPVSGQGQPVGGVPSGGTGSGTGSSDDECEQAQAAPVEPPPASEVKPPLPPKGGYGGGKVLAPVEPPPSAPTRGNGDGSMSKGGQQKQGPAGGTSGDDSGSGYRKRV